MHKDLLVACRYFGDIKLSVNGEAQVAFNVQDVWANSLVQSISSDQGALYPFNEGGRCALADVDTVLSGLTLVPFQNDVRYEKHVTERALRWLHTDAWETLKQGFDDPLVYKVTTRYFEPDAVNPTIVICAELQTNDYCVNFIDAMKSVIACYPVTSIVLDDMLSYRIELDKDGQSEMLITPMDGNLMFVGVNTSREAKYCYETQDGNHILSAIQYDLGSTAHGKHVII